MPIVVSLRPVVGVLTVVACTIAGPLAPALAHVECSDGACRVHMSDSLVFEVGAGGYAEEGTPPSHRLTGDVILYAGSETLHFVDADFVFSETGPGETLPFEMFGTAQAPLGDLPLTAGAVSANPVAAIGMVTRATLRELLDDPDNPLPLAIHATDVEPAYMFFHFASGLELDLGLAELLQLDTSDDATDPFQYNFPGDVSMTMIFDPTDPYLYITSDARDYLKKKLLGEDDVDVEDGPQTEGDDGTDAGDQDTTDGDGSTGDSSGDHNGTGADGDTGTDGGGNGDDTDGAGDGSQPDGSDGDADKDPDGDTGDGISLGSIAFSGHGGIPFAPATTWGLPDTVPTFMGHLYVETEIPLGYGVSISGPIVTHIGPDGFEQGGNGDVAVGFDLFGDVVGLEFPLGSASAGIGVTGEHAYVYFSGMLSPDDSFLPIDIPLMPQTELQVAAYIDSAAPEDTRLLAAGRYALGAGVLGDLIGLDLSEMSVQEALLTMDRDGLLIRGSTTTSLHPDLVFGSEVVIEAFFPWDTLDGAYVLMTGDLRIGGTALGAEASALLSTDGLFIDGAFETPVSRIALHGEITADGPLLVGTASIELPLDQLGDAQDAAVAAVQQARADVERLEGQIAAMRSTVQAERDRDTQNLRDAQAAVGAAQNEVNTLQGQINSRKGSIASHNREIKKWKRWYGKQSWWKKTWAWTKYLHKTGWRYAAISKLGIEIGGLEAAKLTATGALELAKLTLRGMEEAAEVIPIDADPRVLALLGAREGAGEILRATESALTLVDIPDGRLSGQIILSVGLAGVSGTVQATFNDLELVGGSVSFDPLPEACIDVAGLGEACAAF